MIGEVSVFGVYVPSLLLAAFAALILCGAATLILRAIGFYRIVILRPVVDVAIFIFLLAAVCWAGRIAGFTS